MVDSISSNQANPLGLNSLQGDTTLQSVNATATSTTPGTDSANPANQLLDSSDISDAARAKLESEKEVNKYATLSFRSQPEHDTDKVNYFKDMLDSGRINQYLSQISNNDLASSVLSNPTALAALS